MSPVTTFAQGNATHARWLRKEWRGAEIISPSRSLSEASAKRSHQSSGSTRSDGRGGGNDQGWVNRVTTGAKGGCQGKNRGTKQHILLSGNRVSGYRSKRNWDTFARALSAQQRPRISRSKPGSGLGAVVRIEIFLGATDLRFRTVSGEGASGKPTEKGPGDYRAPSVNRGMKGRGGSQLSLYEILFQREGEPLTVFT